MKCKHCKKNINLEHCDELDNLSMYQTGYCWLCVNALQTEGGKDE